MEDMERTREGLALSVARDIASIEYLVTCGVDTGALATIDPDDLDDLDDLSQAVDSADAMEWVGDNVDALVTCDGSPMAAWMFDAADVEVRGRWLPQDGHWIADTYVVVLSDGGPRVDVTFGTHDTATVSVRWSGVTSRDVYAPHLAEYVREGWSNVDA